MSREALLEKIKKAEAAAASDIEAAEKEQVSARNKVPIDQENLINLNYKFLCLKKSY